MKDTLKDAIDSTASALRLKRKEEADLHKQIAAERDELIVIEESAEKTKEAIESLHEQAERKHLEVLEATRRFEFYVSEAINNPY